MVVARLASRILCRCATRQSLLDTTLVLLVSCAVLTAKDQLTFQEAFPPPANVVAAAIDADGNLYLGGSTSSANMPVTSGAFQTSFEPVQCGTIVVRPGLPVVPIWCARAFVAKVDPTGTRLLYLTYLTGDRADSINVIQPAADGSVWVAGSTSSPNFPVTSGQQQTSGGGFLTRLSADGSRLLLSRRLPAAASSLVRDRSDNITVAGTTTAGAAVGTTNAWIMKFDGNANPRWEMQFGGASDETANAVAVDDAGNVYVAGSTSSRGAQGSFPTTPGAYVHPGARNDGFVVKISADGSRLLYASVFGGIADDAIRTIAVNAAGEAYITGIAYGLQGFPVTAGAFDSTTGGPFAAKLSADGSRLLYATFLRVGQSGWIDESALASDARLLLAGWSDNTGYPITSDAAQPCFAEVNPIRFATALSSDGQSLAYSTFLTLRPLGITPSGVTRLAGEHQIAEPATSFDPPPPGAKCAVSAASFLGQTIVPGELVSVFGTSMGPDPPGGAMIDQGRITTELRGTRLLINGIAAPLLYVAPRQVNAVVPFGLNPGDAAHIEVERDGVRQAAIQTRVAFIKPALFTLDSSGSGQAAVLNQDGSVNTEANPAAAGSIVSLFGTGFGGLVPPRQDGEIPHGIGSIPVQRVRVTFRGIEGEVLYAGDAPELVAGVVQVNARMPLPMQPGNVLVSVQVGETYSDWRSQTFIWVR